MATGQIHTYVQLALCLAAWAATAVTAEPEAEPTAKTPSKGTEHCRFHANCRACIRTPDCHWCSLQVIDIGASSVDDSKCVHKSEAVGSWCKGVPWSPVGSYSISDSNSTLQSQIYPKHAKLVLRVGETKRVNITFKKRDDYPIDLYYLMDLSDSMKNDKFQLSKLGSDLAAAMKKVTSNFRIGFGSFVDKVGMPFVFTSPKLLKTPCSRSICATPYSFKNHMPLDKNTTLFSKNVYDTPMSTNNDSPEGGLDALMQAIVCTDHIKWRSDARHLLVFTTDAPYHIAGDGKLVGAVERNPGLCHMNKNNEYTRSTDYDYPTISQINKKALEKQIIILFAVKPFQYADIQYGDLSARIQGSKMEILSADFKNIIRVITEVYDKFDKTVKLIDDAGSKGIGIVYSAHCSNTGELVRTNECNNVTGTTPISFEVDITVKSCPPELNGEMWKTTVNISPHGINESFQLDLEVFCSCPCEYKGHSLYKGKTSTCNYHGEEKCGICECYDNWHGKTCECDRASTVRTEENKFSACITDNKTKTICFGHGTCLCGKCSCYERPNPEEMFYGTYCECDNFSCKRYNGKLCSGPGRGHCSCGKCQCEPGWTGDACECPEMETGCVAPGEDTVCSGFGICKCGKCDCVKDRSGKYCGECMQTLNVTCPGGRCKEFADCVECMIHETGRYASSSCSSCSIPKPNIERTINENNKAHPEERFCKVPDDAGCSFVFTYVEVPKLTLRAEENKECQSSGNLLGIVLGISGTTLFLVILALLIWKLITSIHDRREYAKYLLELDNTKWAALDNPEYQEPTTTTTNPTYKSRRSRFSFMLK